MRRLYPKPVAAQRTEDFTLRDANWTTGKLLHAKKFGCDAYVHVHAVVQRKFTPKSKKGIFVGYSTNSLACVICDGGGNCQQIVLAVLVTTLG